MEMKNFTSDLWQGIRDSSPFLLGVFPFGLTCGIMGLTGELLPAETILMSLLVFAGAAQFAAIAMLATGVAFWVIVLTCLLINLRFLLMGASLAPFMLGQSLTRQSLLSFLLADESYVLTMDRIGRNNYSFFYHLGASLTIYIAWVISTIVGVFVESYISDPLAWGLDFAMPAIFMALLFPRLVSRVSIIVCCTAGVISILGIIYLPGKWYIILACLTAIILGGLLEKPEGEKSNAC